MICFLFVVLLFLYPSFCHFVFFYHHSFCLFVSTLPSIIRTFCERSLYDLQSFCCEINDQNDRE
jgi:hypothetical protein